MGNINNSSFENISPEYKELVEKASKNNEDFFIDNSTIDHARFLTYHLIKKAKETIMIFTGSLMETFYDDILIRKILEEKLEQGVKVKIVSEIHPKAKKCIKLGDKYKNLKISVLFGEKKFPNHFILIDNTAFRYEIEHNPNSVTEKGFEVVGQANFNNRSLGGGLAIVFKTLFDQSKVIL